MIANDEQLAIVKKQVARLESALESLAKTVRPKSERQFRVFAEGYVDQLAVLRDDIDAYLGIATVKNPVPEIEISIEDPDAGLGDTRVSAVTKLADRLRRALRTTVESVRDSLSVVDRENLSDQFIDRLCDPPLQAVAPGSVRIQLAQPHIEVGGDLYEKGLNLLSIAIRSIGGDMDALSELGALTPPQRKAALTAARLLAPEKGDSFSKVGFGGGFIGPQGHVQFDAVSRRKIQRRLSRLEQQSITVTAKGVMREIDLDRRLFTLRDPDSGLTIERCKYAKQLDSQVALFLDHEIEVVGTKKSNALRASRVRVRTISKIEGSDHAG